MLSPDWTDFLVRVGKFVVISTGAYVLLVVVLAWMHDTERGCLDAEAEAFDYGYRSAQGFKAKGEAWADYLSRREIRADRKS